MNAILVIVLVYHAGNPPEFRYFEFPSFALCQSAISTAVVLPKGHDDGRGVQSMFCIPAVAKP